MADKTVTIPHFDLPFRFGAYGQNASVVQQDSNLDVRNCVEACLRTEAGSRLYVPVFGVDDPTFRTVPVDTSQLQQQIALNEPRAEVFLSTGPGDQPWIETLIAEVSTYV